MVNSLPARLRKLCFFGLATPAIWRAGWRLLRHRGLRLDDLAATLRRTEPWSFERLRHPAYLAASVDRWLTALPPWGYGRCFKRSLLLLDLWSRCGLEPVLHLGVRGGQGADAGASPEDGMLERRQFHAWITTGPGGPWTDSDGHREIWRSDGAGV